MPRSHVLAREVRGTVAVVLVALLIAWLFAKLSDDRAEAKAQEALRNTTTTVATTTSTTTTTVVDNDERLCSIAGSFRDDLAAIEIALVSPSGSPRATSLPIDLGYAPDPGATDPATVMAPPRTVDPGRIDPVASGLLGTPQLIALNFYTAASTLRLGLIDADFDASADYFADLVALGEPHAWDRAALAESDFVDRWTALSTQRPVGVDNTLAYIAEVCGLLIGDGFVYQEPAPELPVLDQNLIPAEIDPSVDPEARRRPNQGG